MYSVGEEVIVVGRNWTGYRARIKRRDPGGSAPGYTLEMTHKSDGSPYKHSHSWGIGPFLPEEIVPFQSGLDVILELT